VRERTLLVAPYGDAAAALVGLDVIEIEPENDADYGVTGLLDRDV
jgi:hypothetical protein